MPQAGLELNKTTVISSDEALILEKAPKTIAIVGAGAVGCEFADVFAAFGSKVTLIEVMPRILPLEDEDSSKEVQRSFKKRGIDVLTGAKLTGVKVGKDSVTLTVEAGGEKKEIKVDIVLVAAGRAPNIEDIGLKEAGRAAHRPRLHQDQRDGWRRASKGIYAIGDVAGPPMLAHKGEREGVIVAEVIAGSAFHPLNYGNIPNATYCHPEVASIGLTEAQCKEKKLDYKVGKFPFSANGRAHVGRDRGLREDHSRREVRRDPRRAHRRRARHRADPRAGRGARERVHRRRGRSRDPRASDAVRGDRRGRARFEPRAQAVRRGPGYSAHAAAAARITGRFRRTPCCSSSIRR